MTSSRLDRLTALFAPSDTAHASERATLLTRPERFATARALITAYYAVIFFFTVNDLYAWPGYLAIDSLTPRWPVRWLDLVNLETGIAIVLWLYLAGGLAAITVTRWRAARILVFVALLEHAAFRFSFGSINHGDHLGVLLAFVLIFLPHGWQSVPQPARRVRASTAMVFSGCQGIIMLTYTMAGLWKLGGIIEQTIRGEVSAIAPTGLARQIAGKLLEDQSTTVLGPWLIEHPWLGWPMMLATLYLEVFALWAVRRPSLHRMFGLGLVLFHVASQLTMGVGFAQNVLWLTVFFVLSPMRPERFEWRHVARDLPLLSTLLRQTGRSPTN